MDVAQTKTAGAEQRSKTSENFLEWMKVVAQQTKVGIYVQALAKEQDVDVTLMKVLLQ